MDIILTKERCELSPLYPMSRMYFGRYSLDEKGLVYAGGEFDINRYN